MHNIIGNWNSVSINEDVYWIFPTYLNSQVRLWHVFLPFLFHTHHVHTSWMVSLKLNVNFWKHATIYWNSDITLWGYGGRGKCLCMCTSILGRLMWVSTLCVCVAVSLGGWFGWLRAWGHSLTTDSFVSEHKRLIHLLIHSSHSHLSIFYTFIYYLALSSIYPLIIQPCHIHPPIPHSPSHATFIQPLEFLTSEPWPLSLYATSPCANSYVIDTVVQIQGLPIVKCPVRP